MATTFKELQNTSASLTISLNGLANAAARQSTKIDNTSALSLEELISVTVKTATGSLGTNPVVEVWAFGSLDGTTFPDAISGSDAAFTQLTNPNLVLLGVVNVNTANVNAISKVLPLSLAFGGTVPPYWGLVLVNKSGLALDASAGGSITHMSIQTQGV